MPESAGQILEIGGADVVTYGEMMMTYARVRGLRRWMLPVPVLTPRLSSYWVNVVTPIPGAIARPLIQGLRNENLVRDTRALAMFSRIRPASYAPPVVLTTHEGMILEQRQRVVAAPPEAVYRVFTGIGGARGWFYMNWAWELRGLMDRLTGGVGLRRGRRDPDALRVGDALDFWRVEALEPGRCLRLRAEMKVPGEAWLSFRSSPRRTAAPCSPRPPSSRPKGSPECSTGISSIPCTA